MHEFSIARSLMKQVEAIALREGAERVSSMTIRVGEFSGIDPDLLQSAVTTLADQGRTRNCALNISRVPLTARCAACADVFVVSHFRFVCPSCASTETEIVSGEELILDSVTLERQEDASCPGAREPSIGRQIPRAVRQRRRQP
jgi:hydrogenase nickel incorporation protein HypA/HybF